MELIKLERTHLKFLEVASIKNMTDIRIVNTLDGHPSRLEEVAGFHGPGDGRRAVVHAVVELDGRRDEMVIVEGRDAAHHLQWYLEILLELNVICDPR